MLRIALMAACWLASCGLAYANTTETFELVLTSVSSNSQLNGVPTPYITYALSGGSGSMTGQGDGYGPPTWNASPGFDSLDINGEWITPTNLDGKITFSATDNNASINFLGENTDLNFANGAGTYGTDGPGPCNGGINTCSFTGYFVEVPEPISLLLFGTGLLALYPIRRRLIGPT